MSSIEDYEPLHGADHAPGDEPARGREVAEGVLGYLDRPWPGDPAHGCVLFHRRDVPGLAPQHSDCAGGAGDRSNRRAPGLFLHITTGPDNANNVLALAFGVLIVFLLLVGSLWIMTNLNQNMAPMHMPMG